MRLSNFPSIHSREKVENDFNHKIQWMLWSRKNKNLILPFKSFGAAFPIFSFDLHDVGVLISVDTQKRKASSLTGDYNA